MGITKLELEHIKKQQEEFLDLVNECNYDELGQCAKLLAMYVTLYKQKFGDIPLEEYMQVSESTTFDSDLSQLVQGGLEEASAMLNLVRKETRINKHSFQYQPSSNTIN